MVSLEDIMLHEIIQVQKSKSHMISFIHGSLKVGFIEAESRIIVDTRG
jgi:hypothetical protein